MQYCGAIRMKESKRPANRRVVWCSCGRLCRRSVRRPRASLAPSLASALRRECRRVGPASSVRLLPGLSAGASDASASSVAGGASASGVGDSASGAAPLPQTWRLRARPGRPPTPSERRLQLFSLRRRDHVGGFGLRRGLDGCLRLGGRGAASGSAGPSRRRSRSPSFGSSAVRPRPLGFGRGRRRRGLALARLGASAVFCLSGCCRLSRRSARLRSRTASATGASSAVAAASVSVSSPVDEPERASSEAAS